MVLVPCFDVIGRYFFAAPLLGAHEMITLAMGIMIYLGMPLVTASREHLVVDLAGSALSPTGKRIQQIIVNAIAALTFILFSYLLLFHGIGLAEDLMVTEDFEIEQAPIAGALNPDILAEEARAAAADSSRLNEITCRPRAKRAPQTFITV